MPETARRRASSCVDEPTSILVQPLWGKPLRVTIAADEGGHGGGDMRLLDDLFVGGPATIRSAAPPITPDGAMSILTGIAANQSFATGLPVQVSTLVRF